MHWIVLQLLIITTPTLYVRVASSQELNSTLHLNEYGVPYAFVGETITFTCQTERSNSIGWSSKEYIGVNRLNFASVEPDGTTRAPTESGAVARLIRSYRVDGTVVLVSQLQITVQSVYQVASVTCHNIGIDTVHTTSFRMADNTSITCDAPAICPGEKVSCACITAHSNTLAWSSDQLIGNGGAELMFNLTEPLPARQNASNMNTHAVLSGTSDENGVVVLKSELSFILPSTSFSVILTCENVDHQNSYSIILPIYTSIECATPTTIRADLTTTTEESISTTSIERPSIEFDSSGTSAGGIIAGVVMAVIGTCILLLLLVIITLLIIVRWKSQRKFNSISITLGESKKGPTEVELAPMYFDPGSIAHETASTGDVYAVTDKKQKKKGPTEAEIAQMYSVPDKTKGGGLNYASLDMPTGDIAEKKQKEKGPTEVEIVPMYFDPGSIVHETAPTGDVYAVADKKQKKKGPTEERIQSDSTTGGDLQKQPLDSAPEVNSTSVNDQAPTTVTNSFMCMSTDENHTTAQELDDEAYGSKLDQSITVEPDLETIIESATEEAIPSISTTRGMDRMPVALTCSPLNFEFKTPSMIAESETGGASSNIAPTTIPVKESSLNDMCTSTDKNHTTTQEREDETYRVVHMSAPNLSLPVAVKPKISMYCMYSPFEFEPPSAWMIEKREEQARKGQMYTYGFEWQIQRLTEELQERKCAQEQLEKQLKMILCKTNLQEAKLQAIEDRQKAKLQEIEKCAQEQQLKQQLEMMQCEIEQQKAKLREIESEMEEEKIKLQIDMEQQMAKLQKGQAEMFPVPASVANEAVEANMAGNRDRLHVAPAGNLKRPSVPDSGSGLITKV